MIEAVTLDFGNTLVPVPAAALRGVVAITAQAMAERLGQFDVERVLAVWREEKGQWRFLAWQSNKVPPPAPAAK